MTNNFFQVLAPFGDLGYPLPPQMEVLEPPLVACATATKQQKSKFCTNILSTEPRYRICLS